MAKPSPAGQIRIIVGHYNAGRYGGTADGSAQPVAERDSYLFELILKPVGGAAEQPKPYLIFQNLGLEGRLGAGDAGDLELRDGLRNLLDEALAPLRVLNRLSCDDPRLAPLGEKLAQLTTTSTPKDILALFGEGKQGRIISSGFSAVYPLTNGGTIEITWLAGEGGSTGAQSVPARGQDTILDSGYSNTVIALREENPDKPAKGPGPVYRITSPLELPGSQVSLEQALAEKGRLVVLCEALEDGYGKTTDTGAVEVSQKYKVVQVLSGESAIKEARLDYARIPSIGERRIMKGGQVVWIVRPAAADHPDRPEQWRGLKALPDTPENRKAVLEAVKAAAPPSQPAAGLKADAEALKADPVAVKGFLAKAAEVLAAVAAKTKDDPALKPLAAGKVENYENKVYINVKTEEWWDGFPTKGPERQRGQGGIGLRACAPSSRWTGCGPRSSRPRAVSRGTTG